MARHGRHEERDRSERHSRSRDDRRGSSHHRSDETKEERLLRKAKEYVEREERKKHHDDGSKDRHGGRRHEKERHSKRHDGDDRKHRKRSSGDKRRHRHDSSDESNDHRRDRKRDESRKRLKKEDRHESSRKRHKHEKTKKAHKEKKKESKKIKVNKKDLFPLGDIKGSLPMELLDVDKDYFAFHQHLWIYLYREEGLLFGDLTSEEAREAFERFTRRYNDGKLEAAYYDPKGMPSEALEECKTTRHAWSFNTSETERQSLKYLQEGVRKQTEYDASEQNPLSSNESGPRPIVAQRSTTVPTEIPEERKRMTPEERLAERTANRRLREHVRTAEDEVTGGRKEGRERQIEMRKEKAAAMHGSARDREETAMGGVELDDAALYGGGGSGEASFEDALAREKRRTAHKKEERDARVAELQKKEREKQEATLKMLGLSGIKPGQKITIAPRKDG